jgi:RNA polymerase sigma-70 factor (ECF subfamily)
MTEDAWLAERFEENRNHLRAIAYRMLGSLSEADDAVQESWLRLSRSDVGRIENLGGWLTTVVGRVCLDMLRSRRAQRAESLDARASGPIPIRDNRIDPEDEAVLADSVGLALLVVLDKLTPAERLAFVLHDMFDLSFEEVASIVGRSPAAARQLASRARRRVQGARTAPNADLTRQREVVEAFVAASRRGDFEALLAVLDRDVVLRADAVAAPPDGTVIRGAAEVAKGALGYSSRARFSQPALVNGVVGVVVAPRGRLFLVLDMKVARGRIVEIDLVGDRDRLRLLDLAMLGN